MKLKLGVHGNRSARGVLLGASALVGVASLFVACSASEGTSDGGDAGYDGSGTGGASTGVDGLDPGSDGGLDGIDGFGGTPLPEEEEDNSSYKAPVVAGRFLWSANPESGRVALIDGSTLGVRILSAGLFPTYLAAVPTDEEDEPSALVLNVGSSDASWFHFVDGELIEDRVTTHTGANRIVVSKSGRFAIVYSVAEVGRTLDPTEGLQEITVLHLGGESPEVTRLSVGYRPSRVLVADGDARALVVSEDGVTVLSLEYDEPVIDDWIELGSSSGRDVSLTEDGKHALVRRAGDDSVEVIPVDAPQSAELLDFSGPVTDLDLSPTGRAVAVIRDRSEIATFRFPDVLDSGDVETATFPGETVGSVALSNDGRRAVLYTNAVASDRVTVVSLEGGPGFLVGRTLSTKSPVGSVTTSPDGAHAVVLGATSGVDSTPAASFAVLSLDDARFPRIVGTKVPVRDVAITNSAALVTSTAGDLHQAHWVRLPGLSVSSVTLASKPISAGALLENNQGFVAQSHRDGRITFFDFVSSEARTLTGFELSAQVVDR